MIMERDITLREYIVSLCYFMSDEVIESCVVSYSGRHYIELVFRL